MLESISTFIVFTSPHFGDHFCNIFFGNAFSFCDAPHLRLKHLHRKYGRIDNTNVSVLHDERNAVAAIYAENGADILRDRHLSLCHNFGIVNKSGLCHRSILLERMESRNFPTHFYYTRFGIKVMKKIIKRIAAVAILILAALVISYLIYTGGQLHA